MQQYQSLHYISLLLEFCFSSYPNDEHIARAWHVILSVLALANILYLVGMLRQKKTSRINPSTYCCIIFTLVCAFRSILPRVDAERLCFFDLKEYEIVHSPFVGRSFATVAEICFAYQFTRVWLKVISAVDIPMQTSIANTSWFLCTIAQVFCWIGVLTTNNIWHAVENSLWSISPALLAVGSAVALAKGGHPKNSSNESFLWFTFIGGTCFVSYLVQYDVPMYIQKWKDGVGGGIDLQPYDGLIDSMRCIVSASDALWIPEMFWMSGYFVVGVWLSIRLQTLDHQFHNGSTITSLHNNRKKINE